MTEIKNDFLVLGSNDAPVQIEVFLNLACPYCATFYELVDEVLVDYIQQNKVSFIVKHFDKPREMLLPGALINLNLDYGNPQKALNDIKQLFKEQSTWDQYSNHEIKKYIEEKYNLKEESSNIEKSLSIIGETIERNVLMVPTVFVNNIEFQYPRELSASELKQVIEQQLQKIEV